MKSNSVWIIVLMIFLVISTAGTSTVHSAESVSRDQIGRMIMVGFRGTTIQPNSPIVQQIKNGDVGGVILFETDVPTGQDNRNIRSPKQIKRLIDNLQSLTDRELLIGVDQEGGQIQRLKPEDSFEDYPSHQSLGDRNDTSFTFRTANRLAKNLREYGFNVNFAPVVDLNLNPENPVIGSLDRSFGKNPKVVIWNAYQYIRAHRENHVLPVLKHFPGHGSSRRDSHKGFVDVTKTWRPEELKPYERLIDGGMIPAVMTAHIYNHEWDPTWPASLSRSVINVLRSDFQHKGLVFTDDLQMKALRDHYSRKVILRQSLKAGSDVLIFANNSVYEPKVASQAVDTIKSMVEEGTINPQTIQTSNQRIKRTLENIE